MLGASACCVLLGLSQLLSLIEASPLPSIFTRSSQGLRVPFKKSLSPKSLIKRQGVVDTLTNDVMSYEITVSIGSPAQTVVLQLDTGSSDLWVLSPGACSSDGCTCPSEGCTYYDPNNSDSAQEYTDDSGNPISFDFEYGSGSSSGYYWNDDITVAGVGLSGAIVAVASSSTNEGRGILGVGLETGESSDFPENPHPGVLEMLSAAGYISSNSYSLWLDSTSSSAGEIIFGAVDSSKYTGDLVTLPIVPSPDGMARLTVEWSYFSVTVNGNQEYEADDSGSNGPATLLDSGTSLAYIPSDIFSGVAQVFGLTQDASGTYIGSCDISTWDATLNFGFGDSGNGPEVLINVPASEIMRGSDDGGCVFGFQPSSSSSDPSILGDTFLTSAYVYYDLDASTISLAQSAWS